MLFVVLLPANTFDPSVAVMPEICWLCILPLGAAIQSGIPSFGIEHIVLAHASLTCQFKIHHKSGIAVKKSRTVREVCFVLFLVEERGQASPDFRAALNTLLAL